MVRRAIYIGLRFLSGIPRRRNGHGPATAAAAAAALAILLSLAPGADQNQLPRQEGPTERLSIGETFTLTSTALGERRRINVYMPAAYTASADLRVPVLYMPDGGVAEDFVHVAGLVQVLTGNGGMRPLLLVGIENTDRRRDLTPPTDSAEDRKIAPRVGGSAAFRAFLRDELMPEIRTRYRITGERAIVGESLAGLFIVETLLVTPTLFDTFIAFDPSLWWNDGKLAAGADARLRVTPPTGRTLYLASSRDGELQAPIAALAAAAERAGARVHHQHLADETHASIFHPAALRAFRTVLGPRRESPAAGAAAARVE